MSDSEQLNIDITAKDSASKVVDSLQGKVDKLDGTDAEVDVTADTKSADRSVDALDDQLDKLTNRDKLVVLSLRAAGVTSELRDIAGDLATIDAADPDIDVKFDDYARLSGQLDDIEAKMKGIADADPDAGAGLASARDRLREVGEESGRAKDAIHGMAGNAVGDFAATATGIGPLGEAIGQVTEGLAGAEVGLKGLVTAGLGLGAISGGMLVLNKLMGEFAKRSERAAEIDAFNTKSIDGYTESLRKGTDAVQDWIDRTSEAGRVDLLGNLGTGNIAFDAISTKVRDMSDVLADAGVTLEQFATAATGTDDQLAAFTAAVDEMGLSTENTGLIISAARNEHENYADAVDKATRFSKLMGDEQKAATDAAGKNAAAMGTAALKAAGLGAASRQTARDFDHLSASYRGLTQQFDDESAWLSLQDNFDQAQQAMIDATSATDDQAAATRDARQAQLDLISSVSQYAQEVLKLPASQTTEIVAAINRGDLATANALLDDATKTRTAWINVQVSALTGALLGALTSVQGSAGRPVAGAAPATVNYYLAAPTAARETAAAAGRRARINGR